MNSLDIIITETNAANLKSPARICEHFATIRGPMLDVADWLDRSRIARWILGRKRVTAIVNALLFAVRMGAELCGE